MRPLPAGESLGFYPKSLERGLRSERALELTIAEMCGAELALELSEILFSTTIPLSLSLPVAAGIVAAVLVPVIIVIQFRTQPEREPPGPSAPRLRRSRTRNPESAQR